MMEALLSMFIAYLRADEGRRSHLSEVAFSASENLEAVPDGCVSIGVVAMKEQEGDGMVSADHGFAVRKKVTHCEAFHC